MKAFTSIEQAKSQATFFKEGQIIPTRVLKARKRRDQHRIKFGAGTWVLTGGKGYVCFSHQTPQTCAMRVNGIGGIGITGAPYFNKGGTYFVGNLGLTNAKWLDNINLYYAGV